VPGAPEGSPPLATASAGAGLRFPIGLAWMKRKRGDAPRCAASALPRLGGSLR
jgi:hypothetical protein